MVNKEMMSEEQLFMPYHSTIITPIKNMQEKVPKFTYLPFFSLKIFFRIKLHITVQCACIVKIKYMHIISLSKAVLGVDPPLYALSNHKHNTIE